MIKFRIVFLTVKEVNERGRWKALLSAENSVHHGTSDKKRALTRRPRDASDYCILEEDTNFSANLPLTH